ncbi:MAG: hypothetical protein DYH12_10760 [Sorangiineae bacterium PRO1]|nr:hypothetical protein [Sorangiineae bacterium PRO1]
MTALLRLLELVRRDLGAEDARAEIGGAEPADPRLVSAPHRGGFRVVAVFAAHGAWIRSSSSWPSASPLPERSWWTRTRP